MKDAIRLYTGGYYTVTTKKRMNEISEEFNLGYRVGISKGSWVVEKNGVMYGFANREAIVPR